MSATMAQLVVMVTGAAGNLGRAVAQVFATAGARLVLVDARAATLDAAFGAPDDSRMHAAANLLRQEQVDAAVQSVIDRFGRIDVLCHLAGGFRMGEAVHETGYDTWDFLLDLNARTLIGAARAVVPRMLAVRNGSIVAVAAAGAQKGMAQMGAYCASKAATVRLVEAMSAELRDRGINVNCVLPSVIDTPENRKAVPGADPARWVAPVDLARVIAFLASDEARAVHGAALPVTGLG